MTGLCQSVDGKGNNIRKGKGWKQELRWIYIHMSAPHKECKYYILQNGTDTANLLGLVQRLEFKIHQNRVQCLGKLLRHSSYIGYIGTKSINH